MTERPKLSETRNQRGISQYTEDKIVFEGIYQQNELEHRHIYENIQGRRQRKPEST